MKNSLEQASKPNCMPKHDIIANFSFAHDHYGASSIPTMLFFFFPSSRFIEIVEIQKKWKTTSCKTKFRGTSTCLSFAHNQFLTQHTGEGAKNKSAFLHYKNYLSIVITNDFDD